MAIKNFTTSISSVKTVGEIQAILAKGLARSVSVDFCDGNPIAVRFSMMIGKNEVWFRLPANAEGVLSSLRRDRAPRSCLNLVQAQRVSWRIIKDWIDAQVAIIDAGQAKPAEVFFPYILQGSDGVTLFQKFEDQQLKLTEGNK